jgi:hypothetical protein
LGFTKNVKSQPTRYWAVAEEGRLVLLLIWRFIFGFSLWLESIERTQAVSLSAANETVTTRQIIKIMDFIAPPSNIFTDISSTSMPNPFESTYGIHDGRGGITVGSVGRVSRN